MSTVNAAIIGSGNIGTDLLFKLRRSAILDVKWMVGIDAESVGLQRAADMGVNVTAKGIDGILDVIQHDDIRIAFDATSAAAHAENDRKLRPHGVLLVDLTPAAIGPYCVPPVNLASAFSQGAANVNMVTCGGQATIPIVAAISAAQEVDYAEIIATVASRSAGPGTRKNIDEFTRTTARAVEQVGGARQGKAIIIINPAEPPLKMRVTVHCLTNSGPDQDAIATSIQAMVTNVQRYVPGYVVKNGPVFDGHRVSTFLEIEGLGDFLPSYAGNLDIMTAAAAQTGELIAQNLQSGTTTEA